MWSHSSPEDLSARPLRQQQASTGPLDMANPDVFRNVATDSADAAGSAAAHERDAGTAVWHTSLFATPTAKQSAGNHLACNISANSVLKAPVDPVRVTPHTMVGKHMVKTLSTASSPGGTCSAPLIPTVTTTPIGATPATGKPVSNFCVANTPGAIPHPLSLKFKPRRSWILQPSPFGHYRGDLDVWRPEGDICQSTPQCGATLEGLSGLCAPPGSLASPVSPALWMGICWWKKFATVQMAPVDLAQELMRTMAGLVVTMR
jgi:hypothetical protein